MRRFQVMGVQARNGRWRYIAIDERGRILGSPSDWPVAMAHVCEALRLKRWEDAAGLWTGFRPEAPGALE